MLTVMALDTERTFPALIDEALRPVEPGRLVRMLASFAPGVRTTRDQIASSLGFVERHSREQLRIETQPIDVKHLIQWCLAE